MADDGGADVHPPGGDGPRDITVLHVDDDPEFLDLAGTFLERENEAFTVLTETRARGGLERLDDDRATIDCIVSDYDMPGMDGLEFLEAVREDRPRLPFLLFTGKGSEEIASEAIRAGVCDYIQKGGGSDQYTMLANRIENAVEYGRTRQWAAEESRINELVREILQRLVHATSRDEIEEVVCNCFATAEPYVFAWIGDADPETDELVPRSTADTFRDVLEGVTIRVDDSPRGRGPGGEAYRTRGVQVRQNITDEIDVERWLEVTREHGFESVIALPLCHGEAFYGILVIYADRPRAFDDSEQELLAELADTIAQAITAVEANRRIERREEERRAQQRLFRRVFEGSNDAMFVVDVEADEILEANPAASDLLGYTHEELLDTPVSTIHPDTMEELREFTGSLGPGGGEITTEHPCRTKAGTVVPAEISASTIEYDGRECLLAIARDITERRRRRRELERANERLEEFASVVSHDLQNPLNVASGNLDLAIETGDPSYLDVVREALDSMERLIEDLLRLSRDGRQTDEAEPVSLSGVVDRAWDHTVTRKATLEVERDLDTVSADGDRLIQLLENLFHNAVEHGDDDATIRVGQLDGGFYVEDDGPGIPEGERDAVFERGYSTADEGTGFGLAIVDRIADAHGWDVRAVEGREDGARFEITGVDTE